MNNVVFGKTMKNVESIAILNLVLEPNYHTTKLFTEDLLAREMKKKTEILMNKPFYLRLSILEISKMIMYEFWYDYISSIDEYEFSSKNSNWKNKNLLIY